MKKERYELMTFDNNKILLFDNSLIVSDVKNIEDLRNFINELNTEIDGLKSQVEKWKQICERRKEDLKDIKSNYRSQIVTLLNARLNLFKQRKQSQNQKAIEELEKIINLFEPYENDNKDTILCANNGISFIEYTDNRIKELRGEDNEH